LQPPERSPVLRLLVEIIEILINTILIGLAPISLIFTQSRGSNSSSFREMNSLARLPVSTTPEEPAGKRGSQTTLLAN
jgi:hypothetical protein